MFRFLSTFTERPIILISVPLQSIFMNSHEWQFESTRDSLIHIYYATNLLMKIKVLSIFKKLIICFHQFSIQHNSTIFLFIRRTDLHFSYFQFVLIPMSFQLRFIKSTLIAFFTVWHEEKCILYFSRRSCVISQCRPQ